MDATVSLDDARKRARFNGPTWYYDEEGDCIEFVTSDERFYAERKDQWVTAYYSFKTGELVGSMIKDVTLLLQQNPGFAGIELHEGRVSLSHLYRLSGWTCSKQSAEVEQVYRQLIKCAEDSKAQVELAC